MYVVSVMPCVAKKYEKTRDGLKNNGLENVDSVITTRELAKMIKDNPAGQEKTLTPIVLIRRKKKKSITSNCRRIHKNS